MSPFCIKLETYLRFTQTAYTTASANMMKAPKGKVPYVQIDGNFMADSQLIIEHIESTRETPLNQGLSEAQQAIGHMVQRTLDEAFYFIGMYLRWIPDDSFASVSSEFKKFLPKGVSFMLRFIRSRTRKALFLQGTGRHTDDEIQNKGAADMVALARILGTKPYLLRDSPTTYDTSVYAFLEAVLGFPHDSKVKRTAVENTNLVEYRDRIRETWWKDIYDGFVSKQG